MKELGGFVGRRLSWPGVENALCHACKHEHTAAGDITSFLKCEEMILCPHCHRILLLGRSKRGNIIKRNGRSKTNDRWVQPC